MNERILLLPQKAYAPAFAQVHGGILQRKFACEATPRLKGECEKCRKKKHLQRRAANQSAPTDVLPIVHEVLRPLGQHMNLSYLGCYIT